MLQEEMNRKREVIDVGQVEWQVYGLVAYEYVK